MALPPPPPSILDLVKDNPQADELWKRWLASVYESLELDFVNIDHLPTTDPAVAGVLWNDSGEIKTSTG